MLEPFSWPHVTRIRVRFRDLDAFGHVNNAVFLTYLEQARTDCYLRLSGREDPFETDAGLDFVVARAEIDYLAPVRHDEELAIEVRPTRLGRKSFSLAYEARRDPGEIVARGLTVQVAYDHAAGASRPLDAGLAAGLRAGLPEDAP